MSSKDTEELNDIAMVTHIVFDSVDILKDLSSVALAVEAKDPTYTPDLGNLDGPLGPRGLAEATEMCTQECLVLGHSDNCWMPPSLGPYQQPKSPLSTFAPQKEWVKKDKLVNGHTLTRTWKEDSNRNQFSDRKQYGSSEGHFNTGNHMTDIPLANLKSYKQASGAVESPKEHQL
ncbi:protocadherin-9 isoform x2 [Limosa lapponica baueri]|uniref:Protocadherin-9 isoform x2 n=1 Tax=Limosa lapponica baueri TaxID=1758121 RepID=A0A2I0UE57_LIMLA|nr:protocadherin-9 isoform x2 [Limosa lapponica baueri]